MTVKLLFASLVLLALTGCPEREQATPKFNHGDRVKLVADPRYNNGIIYHIWCRVDFCTYDVRFGLYRSEGMIGAELELR